MIGRIVFIAKVADDANMRRIHRLSPQPMAVQAMISSGLRVLADKLEAEQAERASEQPIPFANAVEELYG